MSLMQLPAPNTSAKVIVSIREALLLFELCIHQLHGRAAQGHLLFIHKNRRAFQTRKCDDACLLKTQISRSSDFL